MHGGKTYGQLLVFATLWVVNPNKPAKLREVHDVAARSSGVSVNSLLLTGPNFLRKQFRIVKRLMEGKIAFTADIKEMFRRFLYCDDPSGPIKSSMIFGACSSPSTAIYIS